MKKIYVVGNWTEYASWIRDSKLVDSVEEADIVLFTGGEDVHPDMYDREMHPRTYANIRRDIQEKSIFDSVREDQMCLGICRGSQFLCVMNGGILVQHCTNHALGYTHPITNGSEVYDITSTHHQMQYPFVISPEYYDILYAAKHRSDTYEGDGVSYENLVKYGDPEIVYYHVPGNPKCLAIQGHPEMMREDSPTIAMLNNLVDSIWKK